MALTLAGLLGAVLGALAALVVVTLRARAGRHRPAPRSTFDPRAPSATQRIPEAVLAELSIGAAVLADGDRVTLVNRAAHTLGVVRDRATLAPELRRIVHQVRRDGVRRSLRVTLPGTGLPSNSVPVLVSAFSVGGNDVAVIAEDVTELDRVESVRRDFVANVGHEIKTPVGAIALLAEAALDAGEDREAVQRFLLRMQHEAGRLSRLVHELIELSRLQGGEPLPERVPTSLTAVIDDATDQVRAAADAKGITVVRGGDVDVMAIGTHNQLVTAVRNLLENAVAYSGPNTQVAVGVHRRADHIEIAVKDEGLGIDRDDLSRIFERFYRADPARSRATGGTGLGLAIVKHIVSNHGGEVTVSSRVGAGSTFTIHLPVRHAAVAQDDAGQRQEVRA